MIRESASNGARSSVPCAALCAALCFAVGAARAAAPSAPAATASAIDNDYVIRDFHFASGETLPELRLHYITIGKLRRDAHGRAMNAVLILHGMGNSGRSFINERFAGVLFGHGQPLDTAKYFIILPDAIGHGKSSKPSDGLHARFPQYGYQDMLAAQYTLLLQGVQVDHLRLVLGTSMGGMQTFMWGETYPDMMDALMALACLPVQIAGRDRLWRDLLTGAIRDDPEWLQGEYQSEPSNALRTAAGLMMIAESAPLQMQLSLPTRDAADEFLKKFMQRELDELDANDLLYQTAASRDYDPSAGLEKIKAPLILVNSADDFIDPPELGVAEREIKRVPGARFVLLPASDQTHGHGTYLWAGLWQQYLAPLLGTSNPPTSN
jgi:homoserine O-acetyltransferase